jgi:protein-export membrane protein SecD
MSAEGNQVESSKTVPIWVMRLFALFMLVVGAVLGYFVYYSETTDSSRFGFRLGLDLSGGTHLVYRADTTEISSTEVEEAMEALRSIIERRVNSRDVAGAIGVFDPAVQVSRPGAISEDNSWRLIVELPGVTDVDEAKAIIGSTPTLEFKLVDPQYESTVSEVLGGDFEAIPSDGYIATGLTGRFLQGSELQFGQGSGGGLSNEPIVVLEFNSEGAALFAEITREHTGEVLAIFLDGVPIELPVIREEIPNGTAVISGNFTPDEAREAVRNLNLGALPVPITPLSTQSIGASLGEETLSQGISAALWGFVAVALFMIIWYRLPGLISVLALSVYVAAVLVVFKLLAVTLTAAGIAGFILSIGMAVDANVLIFERMKEELKRGKVVREAVRDGFSRAWPSIRDGNLSSLITAVVIFYAGTFLTKGFAVTLVIGILISMISAITITRTLLLALGSTENKGVIKSLYGQGIRF